MYVLRQITTSILPRLARKNFYLFRHPDANWPFGQHAFRLNNTASNTTFTPASDVFGEKFTPVFGSHLVKVLEKSAVLDDHANYSYHDLFRLAGSIRDLIVNKGGVPPSAASFSGLSTNGSAAHIAASPGGSVHCNDESVARIAFLCPADVRYVATLWAVWLAGLAAVPLFHEHPINLMEYYVRDCGASLIVGTNEFEGKLKQLSQITGIPVLIMPDVNKIGLGAAWEDSPSWSALDRHDALLMYTSGTTGPPKGVVLRHANIRFQTSQIRYAWNWTSEDRMLHSLPLHHTHGIISGILTPLYSGACVRMLPKFDVNRIWDHLLLETEKQFPITVFMGVPTMYVKLLRHYDQHLSSSLSLTKVHTVVRSHMRLFISGSAALPEPVYEAIFKVMGMEILERYGMTEVGIPLSNSLHGRRYAGL